MKSSYTIEMRRRKEVTIAGLGGGRKEVPRKEVPIAGLGGGGMGGEKIGTAHV